MNFLSYKKKETSAFYREQIEIYCFFEQRIRRKKINLVNSEWAGVHRSWIDGMIKKSLYNTVCAFRVFNMQNTLSNSVFDHK